MKPSNAPNLFRIKLHLESPDQVDFQAQHNDLFIVCLLH